MRKALIFTFALFLVISGCCPSLTTSKTENSQKTGIEKSEDLEGVAALVNGEKIMRSEVNEQLLKIKAQHKTEEEKKKFDLEEKKFRASVIEQLINDVLYAQEAKNLKIVVTDTEVAEEVEETKKRFPNEEEFEQALVDAQFNMDDLKDFIRKNLIVKRVNEEAMKTSDDEAESYFVENPDEFEDMGISEFSALPKEGKEVVKIKKWLHDTKMDSNIKILD